MPHSKTIKLYNSVPTSLRVILTSRTHFHHSILLYGCAVLAEHLSAFSAQFRVTSEVLTLLADKIIDVLLEHFQLVLILLNAFRNYNQIAINL